MLAGILCTRNALAPIHPVRNFSLNEWRNWKHDELERRAEILEIEPEAIKTIAEIAARQAANLAQTERQKSAELRLELRRIGLKIRASHLEALNDERERIIDKEIISGIQLMIENQDVMAIIAIATVH